MKYVGRIFTGIIFIALFYLTGVFTEWNFDFTAWHPLTRLFVGLGVLTGVTATLGIKLK